MFFTSIIIDVIPVEAAKLHYDINEVLSLLIQKRYSNKVIPKLGLVIGLYDILEVIECSIKAGDGRIHHKVKIRLMIFKPFKGEILDGVIIGSDPSGLQLSLEFFQDVKVYQNKLREPKGFDMEEKLWWWEFDGHRLYYDRNQLLRFKVQDVQYPEYERVRGGQNSTSTEYQPPMIISGAADCDGLGMKHWWE